MRTWSETTRWFGMFIISIAGISAAIILLTALLYLPIPKESVAAQAQIERFEADFVMTKKAVEVLEYDIRGFKTSSWTYNLVVMRHRRSGDCWIGTYHADNTLSFASARSEVCK